MKDKSMKYGVLMLCFFALKKKKKTFLIKLAVSVNAVANSLTRKKQKNKKNPQEHFALSLCQQRASGQLSRYSSGKCTHAARAFLSLPFFPQSSSPSLVFLSLSPPLPLRLASLSGKSLTEAPSRTMHSTSRS